MAKINNLVIPELKPYHRKLDALFVSLNTKELNRTLDKKLSKLDEKSTEQIKAFNALAKQVIITATKEKYIPYKPEYRLKYKKHQGHVLTGYQNPSVKHHQSLKKLYKNWGRKAFVDATPARMVKTNEYTKRVNTGKYFGRYKDTTRTIKQQELVPRTNTIGKSISGKDITPKTLLTATRRIRSMYLNAEDIDRKKSLHSRYLYGGIETARGQFSYIKQGEYAEEERRVKRGETSWLLKKGKVVNRKITVKGRRKPRYKTITTTGPEHKVLKKLTKGIREEGIDKWHRDPNNPDDYIERKHRYANDKVREITPHISDANTWKIVEGTILNNSHKNASNSVYGANNNIYVGYQYFNEDYNHEPHSSTEIGESGEPEHPLLGTRRWFEVLMNEYQSEDADEAGLGEQRQKMIDKSKYASIIMKALKK